MTQSFEEFLKEKMWRETSMQPCVRIIDLGEWAWKQCKEDILHWANIDEGIEYFWKKYFRQEKRGKNRSAYALLTKICVGCLGMEEVEKRLQEMKDNG